MLVRRTRQKPHLRIGLPVVGFEAQLRVHWPYCVARAGLRIDTRGGKQQQTHGSKANCDCAPAPVFGHNTDSFCSSLHHPPLDSLPAAAAPRLCLLIAPIREMQSLAAL